MAACRWPLRSLSGKRSPAIVSGSLYAWFQMLVTPGEGPLARHTSPWTRNTFHPLSPPPPRPEFFLLESPSFSMTWPVTLHFQQKWLLYTILQCFPQIIPGNLKNKTKQKNKTNKEIPRPYFTDYLKNSPGIDPRARLRNHCSGANSTKQGITLGGCHSAGLSMRIADKLWVTLLQGPHLGKHLSLGKPPEGQDTYYPIIPSAEWDLAHLSDEPRKLLCH